MVFVFRKDVLKKKIPKFDDGGLFCQENYEFRPCSHRLVSLTIGNSVHPLINPLSPPLQITVKAAYWD